MRPKQARPAPRIRSRRLGLPLSDSICSTLHRHIRRPRSGQRAGIPLDLRVRLRYLAAVLNLLLFFGNYRPAAIDRLCFSRNVRHGLTVAQTCQALAKAYAADWQALMRNLDRSDLAWLLEQEATDGYALPSAAGYSKAALGEMALRTFRDGETLPQFELVATGEDDDDDESDDGSDDAGPLGTEAFAFDEQASKSPARDYQRELIVALENAVARATPGSKLRITVATGGGKTRIANDWIWEHALPRGHKVLWVTKDWPLLRQAAADLCRRRRGAPNKLGYCGAKGARQLSALRERVNASVVYTTIHTWRRRKDGAFRNANFDLVIIDEVHWGENKRAYRDLLRRFRDRAVFIGLTATPREGTGFEPVGKTFDYPTLTNRGWLARRVVEPPVPTGVAWSPARSTSHGDFDRRSLSKLARSSRRNRLIVETYLKGRMRFGKTLIFACDIEHAMALASQLDGASVSAAALHSNMRSEDREAVLRDFTNGTTRVLVNVAMMTHGIDIPDIETVFLARPTASPTLFAQMVGRAVRKTETKEHFRLVDFVDNLSVHDEILMSPQQYFGDVTADRVVSARYRPAPKRAHHSYAKAKFEHIRTTKGYEEIVGFDLQPTQTFGIEFELTRDDFDGSRPRDWHAIANALLGALPVEKATRVHVDYHDDDKDHSVWNVEWDGSCGWEVTSRVLSGASGYFEVVDVCRALADAAPRLGLKVSQRTGTHVHLGWAPTIQQLRRLMHLVAHFEPALYSLVAPSRSGNVYCEPIRKHLKRLVALPSQSAWEEHFSVADRRYLTVNPANLFAEKKTVEVRMHSGTIEGPKILGWLSLWMRILDVAHGRRELPEGRTSMRDLPLTTGPQGDVAQLAEFVLAHGELSAYLRHRRSVVQENWLRDPKHMHKAGAVAATWA